LNSKKLEIKMCRIRNKKYILSIGDKLNQQWSEAANDLNITKSEVLRRSIVLLYHASKAEKVIFEYSKKTKEMLIK